MPLPAKKYSRATSKRTGTKALKKNPSAPKGMTGDQKKRYLQYKDQFSKQSKAELESYIERNKEKNRGKKASDRYKAAKAVLASKKRASTKRKSGSTTLVKSGKKTTKKKTTSKKKAAAKKTTSTKKRSGAVGTITAAKLRPDKNGVYQWNRVSSASLLAYLKSCVKASRCDSKKYKSARAAAGRRKDITKTQLKDLGSATHSKKTGKTTSKKKTAPKKKTTKKTASKKKTAPKKKTTKKTSAKKAKKVTAPKRYNAGGYSSYDLANKLEASLLKGRPGPLRTALNREYNKRKKNGVLPVSVMDRIEKIKGGDAYKARKKTHKKNVKSGKSKTYKKTIQATKKKRAVARPKASDISRFGFYNPNDDTFVKSSIAAELRAMDNKLAASKNPAKVTATKRQRAAMDAARRSGDGTLLRMIEDINGKYKKRYSTTKNLGKTGSILAQNPFSNPGYRVVSGLGITTIIASNVASKVLRGGIDLVLQKIEEGDKTSTIRSNYGLMIRNAVPLTVGIITTVVGAVGGSDFLATVGGGMLTDSVPFLLRTIASTQSKEAPRWLGGPVANRLELKEPVKLWPGVAATDSTAAKDAKAGANVKGYLPEGEAEALAQRNYWEQVQQVRGYQPRGLLNGYRQESVESLSGMGKDGGRYYSDRMSGVGKAIALVRTNRRRRLMAGYMVTQ